MGNSIGDWGKPTREAMAMMAKARAQCEECPFKAATFVWGEGPQDARLVVIGEAPGRVEDEEGRPFIGPSGQLLRNTLKANGINVETEVYFTNVMSCRPHSNRTPTKEEVGHCRQRLEDELSLLHPEIIILAGKTAAEALLGGYIRMKYHVNKFTPWRSKRCLILYHPAAVLRDSKLMYSFVKGIQMCIKQKKITQEKLF